MRKLLLILAGITAAVGIAIGGWKVKEQIEHKQMVDIVKSEEVKDLLKNRLKTYDKNSLTEQGIIKSYKIDEASIKSNPMGGIDFKVFLNNDRAYYVRYRVEKNQDGNYSLGGGSKSTNFEKLLQERIYE
ncbi:DUF1310 family protein [Streptococcus sp. H31]|uniref:DUF1310 family protein n=1 Tax=Streptococcus huangxiaojuni TaxID=3237239 RepID=UPI0034A19114